MTIQKFTRVISQPVKGLVYKMHLKIINLDKETGRIDNFHNLFCIEGKKYLKLDLQSFLTLELSSEFWSPDKTLLIDQRNIHKLVKGFTMMKKALYTNDIFATNKNNEVVIYKDMAERYTVNIQMGRTTGFILKPTIIYDENELSYEGVLLFINKTENYVELSIDAFEALCYAIEKTDIFTYSQSMINYFTNFYKDNVEKEKREVYFNKRKDIFNETPKVESTLTKKIENPLDEF